MGSVGGRAWLAGAAIAFALGGLLVLWVAHGPGRVADGVPAVVTGWTLAASGLLASGVVRWSRVGPLLVLTALAWFIPDLGTCLNVEPLGHRCVRLVGAAGIASALHWAWLGVLATAVLTYPEGRARTVTGRVAVVAAAALAIALAVWPAPARGAMALLLVAGPLSAFARPGHQRVAEGLAAPIAGAALAAGLLSGGVPFALEGSVIMASLIMLIGLLALMRSRAVMDADRAVALGPALAQALGDPELRVAVRAPGGPGWLDEGGRVSNPTDRAEGMASTTIERDGQALAVITHDPTTLADPVVRAAVQTAVELAAHNTRLRAELDTHLMELEASRRRLVDVGLREREELGDRVQADVLVRLDHLADIVDGAATGPASPDVRTRLARASSQIDLARTEIQDLARGLYPAALATSGLSGALADLAERSPLDITLEVAADVTGGPEVDATAYFLCAEALANATRHAPGSRVRITIARAAEGLALVVTDDGIGGASEAGGTGIRGLRDRVEALGGTLVIDSARGVGTRLAATIPVQREARDRT